MKTLLHLLPLVAALTVVAGGPTEQLLGNRTAMLKRIAGIVESSASELNLILDGLRAAQATSRGEQKTIIDASVQSVEAILQDPNSAGMGGLLPLVNLLHTHNTDESPQIIPGVENSRAQIGLNYLIEGIFNARMMGAADTTTEQGLEEMIRFHAGNPAQTSETSWMGNDEMLFVFGDRVINTLATKVPDRIDAFYKAVQDVRKNPGSRSWPAEQLTNYEAAFARLEMLATKRVLPKADYSEAGDTASPQVPSHVQPTAPRKPTDQKPAPSTAVEEPSSSTRWPLAAVVVVAALGLLWVLLKNRENS